ncbi:ATP-binding protein [Spirosoma flavum]|uniref:ATP-binding protein n=1 Tax=Spirosoma flavum TaxID=2048557 RepID=A0ABW6AQF2_9BACT
MIYPRTIFPAIQEQLQSNKVIVITGTRRVGKTVLLRQIQEQTRLVTLWLNGEDFDVQALLAQRSVAAYGRLLGDTELLLIDEAQAVPEVGRVLKLMIDSFAKLTIVATGSSAFDLTNQTGEPLTGRRIHFDLFPLAQLELGRNENSLQTRQQLEDRLVFGSYPEVVGLATSVQKIDYLRELVNSYLLKDILMYEQVKNSAKLLQLLQLIALQAGGEVSYDELGRQLGISKSTVERYLDLLAKVFIIFRLGGYSNNLRKEVTKSSKWYFFDNGIRNALIPNFSLLAQRQDIGALWENYLIAERRKVNSYQRRAVESYFWRTYDGQEIDLLEQEDGHLSAFEFKWQNRRVRVPGSFDKAYPNATFEVVHQENYVDFIVPSYPAS